MAGRWPTAPTLLSRPQDRPQRSPHGPSGHPLPSRDRGPSAKQRLERRAHLLVSLDQIAQEYTDAREALDKTPLVEAVRFYERFGRTVKAAKSIPAIVDELNADLRADGKSEYHLRDTKRRLETSAMLPKDFRAWNTIYGYFRRWSQDWTWKFIHDRLRERLRKASGRRAALTAANCAWTL